MDRNEFVAGILIGTGLSVPVIFIVTSQNLLMVKLVAVVACVLSALWLGIAFACYKQSTRHQRFLLRQLAEARRLRSTKFFKHLNSRN